VVLTVGCRTADGGPAGAVVDKAPARSTVANSVARGASVDVRRA
jgi:hypothetical protein